MQWIRSSKVVIVIGLLSFTSLSLTVVDVFFCYLHLDNPLYSQWVENEEKNPDSLQTKRSAMKLLI